MKLFLVVATATKFYCSSITSTNINVFIVFVSVSVMGTTLMNVIAV